MSLPQLINGADCGPVNPLMGMMKQMGRDTSLQQVCRGAKDRHLLTYQDRLRGPEAESSRQGRSGFRNRNNISHEAQMADEFFAQQAGGPSNAGVAQQGAFDLSAMRRELDMARSGQTVPPGPAWAGEFLKQQNDLRGKGRMVEHGPEWAEFEAIFDKATQQDFQRGGEWVNDFAQFEQAHPNLQIGHEDNVAFEEAFAQAKTASEWESQFVETESWATEFNKQEEERVLDPNARSALARTAGLLIESIKEETNPKFRNSSFLTLMRKLRDEEVAIEGDKMVEQVKPAGSWAAEFDSQGKGDWSKEFANGQHGADWAKDFNQQRANEHSMNPTETGSAWAEEFQQFHPESSMAQQAEAESSRWAEDFRNRFDNPDEDDMQAAFARVQAGLGPASQKEEVIHSAQAREWDAMQQDWDAYEATTTGFQHVQPGMYNKYQFTRNNPYITGQQVDRQVESAQQDSVLEKEAEVRQDPENARKWFELGCRQQENERESAAIAALQKAVELDPKLLDAWMSLAVSYTNENLRGDAYDALQTWVQGHESYKLLPAVARVKGTASRQGEDRHELLTNAFLEAVRSRSSDKMDPDVQIGLGILFNISEEYEKAIDCFQAALGARPRDHLLWNKLGATLANSHQPAKAIEAYQNALMLQPSYTRAMYNLAIAKININAYDDAVQHLLSALALQTADDGQEAGMDTDVNRQAFRSDKGPSDGMYSEIGQPSSGKGITSTSVWDTLRMSLYLLNRPDLATKCDERDLDYFRQHFEF